MVWKLTFKIVIVVGEYKDVRLKRCQTRSFLNHVLLCLDWQDLAYSKILIDNLDEANNVLLPQGLYSICHPYGNQIDAINQD